MSCIEALWLDEKLEKQIRMPKMTKDLGDLWWLLYPASGFQKFPLKVCAVVVVKWSSFLPLFDDWVRIPLKSQFCCGTDVDEKTKTEQKEAEADLAHFSQSFPTQSCIPRLVFWSLFSIRMCLKKHKERSAGQGTFLVRKWVKKVFPFFFRRWRKMKKKEKELSLNRQQQKFVQKKKN